MNTFKNCETILFDLDGTLSDSKIGIIRCLQYSLEKFNIKETNIKKLTNCIGPSLAHTYQELYGLNHEQSQKAIEFYRERFEREGINENFLFKGIEELIRKLNLLGKNVVLATAKPTPHAKKILEHHKIDHYFTEIVGSNLDGTRENKGEIIAFALEKLKVNEMHKVVMIGDRKYDILGARENKISVIGAGYGYGTKEELIDAKPDVIVNSVEELKAILL